MKILNLLDSIMVFTEQDNGIAFGNVYLKQKGKIFMQTV